MAAKAAGKTVVLIGSHFGAGNDLLKRVFGELCQRPRLSLRCEPTWGGQHDLKTLASFKGRNKRLVWLESDADSLLRTMRNLRAHASNFRLVHVLWDPMHACTAQWPLAGGNASLAAVCEGLRMDALPGLYRRAKRDRTRVLQLRLEDLVSRRSAVGAASWRQLFKFLELREFSADLSAIGTRAIADMEMRARVRNLAAPEWVKPAIASNSSLHTWLRKLRRDLEYSNRGGGGSGGGGGGSGSSGLTLLGTAAHAIASSAGATGGGG